MSAQCDRIIFFDLETSSLHRVGQILNYCFVCVDKQWKELERIHGSVRLSRLDLPDPMAIAATGINVQELLSTSVPSEFAAISKINEFLKKWEGPKTGLSGYNTESFDIPYLRTSLVRNGFYPYLKLKSCDLMILTQSIFARHDDLRAEYYQFLKDKQGTESPRFSIKLEYVASFFSVLQAPQSHESQDDVNVTIALAKLYHSKFGESLFEFEPYDLYAAQKPSGDPVAVMTYGRQWENPIKEDLFCFLRVEGGASYWTNLAEFSKWKANPKEKLPIRRFKHCEALRGVGRTLKPTSEQKKLSKTAFDELKGFRTDDLYPPKNVYIEQWIYRLAPSEMNVLADLINQRIENFEQIEQSAKNVNDLKSLYRRFLLANASSEQLKKELLSNFQRYASFRYDGKMALYMDGEPDKPSDRPTTHLTFRQLYDLIDVAVKRLKEDQFHKQKFNALTALRQHYDESEIRSALTPAAKSAA